MDTDLLISSRGIAAGVSKEYYSKAFSALSAQRIGVWEYDISSKTLCFLNNYSELLQLSSIGISDDALTCFENYVHPADLEKLYSAFDKALAGTSPVIQVKYRLQGSREETIWVEDTVFSYCNHPEKESVKIVGYSKNIQETAQMLENRFDKFLQASPGFIFIFDKNFYFDDVFISEGESLLHPVKELIGLDAHKVFSPEVCELYKKNIQECLQYGKLKEIEYHLDMNDVRYYFQARIVPYEGDKVLALIYDIGNRVTRIRELIDAKQKAEEADGMKSAFLANMSHEIRTPLNAIVGFSEMIAWEEDPEHRNEYVEIIRTNSSLLLQLINDILDISRIEAGKSDINFQNTEITTLVEEVSCVHQLKMKPGVELITICPKEKIWLSTDPNRVKQILYNFLSNAIKNTESGSITIKLAPGENKKMVFSVTDTGRGIESDKLDTIFNRFEKLNSFTQGTGLGLAISKSLIEHLGGSVKVESVFGEGSTFSFTLPCQQVASRKVRKTEGPEEKRDRKKRILVMEPVDSDYAFILIALDGTFSLSRATNEEQLVDMFAAGHYDLVMMNVNKEVEKSRTALRGIYEISPHASVIAIVEHGNYTERHKVLEVGCVDVVTKPYSRTDLHEAVVTHI